MEYLNVGLCKGRHPLPVEDYIFPGQVNPVDTQGLLELALDFVEAKCQPRRSCFAAAPNTFDGVVGLRSRSGLNLYVTGLTAATAAVVRACALTGTPLSLRHYDAGTGGYYSQVVFSEGDFGC